MLTINTPQDTAHAAKLLKERHPDQCRCNHCNKCKCENCAYTKKHGGYVVCLAKLNKATRHDDKRARRPNEFFAGTVAILCIMFLGLLAACLN